MNKKKRSFHHLNADQAPEFNSKMLHWITNRKYKITSSLAASEEVRNGKDQALA